ncbi:MAG TPA: hypothetical protein VEW69_05650 [Alphaproteobacteria bacterium]|nr:hypothetical protein [Alphaproteobacteria bacterium]
MAENNELYQRTERLEAEFRSVLSAAETMQRNHSHMRYLRYAGLLLVAMLMAASWALGAAAPKQGGPENAPFIVRDSSGNLIFQVNDKPRGFLMFNAQNKPAGGGTVTDTSSFFKVSSADQSTNIVMGVDNMNPLMKLRYGGEQSDRIAMQVIGGKPVINMSSSTGTIILRMVQGASGGGELLLSNSSGLIRVNAGISPAQFGRVETLPLGNPIGSFIVGRVAE